MGRFSRTALISLTVVLALVLTLAWPSGSGPLGLASATVEQVVDQNGNCLLEDSEILQAVGYWITGEPVPKAGSTIDDSKILELMTLWVSNESICAAPQAQDVAQAFLAIINRYRSRSSQCWDMAAQGWIAWPGWATRNLTLSQPLNDAAVYHSRFMAEHDCFAHNCPGEEDLPARVERFGYTGWTLIGENIAAGVEAPEEAFEAWRSSPDHNRNMLTCQFRDLGVGRVYDPDPDDRYRWYWTTVFGSRWLCSGHDYDHDVR